MWSSIGRATVRQVRVARLPIRSASRLAVQLAPRRATPSIPSGIRVAAVFARGFAQRSRPKQTSTSEAPKTKKAAAAKKKTGKPKARTAAKKAASRPKKELTEEEKAKLAEREKRRELDALKKKALLKEQPAPLPTAPWVLFVSTRMKELTSQTPGAQVVFSDLMPKVAAEYKALPPAELEKLKATASQNKIANEIAKKNFIESRPVHEIRAANLARKALRRKFGVQRVGTLSDPRFPKQTVGPYFAYLKSRLHAADLAGLDHSAKTARLASEWKNLGEEERKPFIEMSATDSLRYQREIEAYRKEAGL
ncbi:4948b468-bb2d-4ba7-8b43-c2e639762a7c [Thermothielavioides terrestris]|uniref:HMG box domain-containing protein n=2 Tax=Thermothielavioides terrestris TaxID=2587410 RepID=G2QY28_THETT|nr:uncharacterized protein THITE_2112191 [Thermothielavioides terrestris NRRL 8126]AEO65322.1 hypothetical protein THITE_2112191 [Thermothielavioides terrestris NRRL 8126]SPQ19425.1 4948b468-bb2d-4ba7-8b43-c2e639762a7c [Thermothielavioides terrestris]